MCVRISWKININAISCQWVKTCSFTFARQKKSLSINWFNFILDISRLTCTYWWIIKEKISLTLMSGHRDRQKGSTMPHSLNRLSMNRQKAIFSCCWKLNRAVVWDCGNFFILLVSSFIPHRKITMKILNLNDLHWISHLLSWFHYRPLSFLFCGNCRFILTLFIFLSYCTRLEFKMTTWMIFKI